MPPEVSTPHSASTAPVYGCQLGTECPILHAKQDQLHPVAVGAPKNTGEDTKRQSKTMAVGTSECLAVLPLVLLHLVFLLLRTRLDVCVVVACKAAKKNPTR
jgi:hypothetical protein